MRWFFVIATRKMHAFMRCTLTTANQSKMRRAHLVSVDIGADWVESGGTGESPQPEATEKQAGWVENGRAGENPQPEAMRSKQVG